MIVASRTSIAPQGWVGVVALGDACLVVAPNSETADLVTQQVDAIRPAAVPWLGWQQMDTILGPTALFFGALRTEPADTGIARRPDDPRLKSFIDRVSVEEAGEAALSEVTSRVFAWLHEGEVVAAAGYCQWPGELAHISVLTDPGFRRRGYARIVAADVIRDARRVGLTPQWRARPLPSQRLAESLGLVHIGNQVSVHIVA